MLQREGIAINHKKTYRLYKTAGLALQKRSKKTKYEKRGIPERTAVEANARWSMDFVSDRTRYGSNIRVLTVIDEVTRECPALEAQFEYWGQVTTFKQAFENRGYPQQLMFRSDPGHTVYIKNLSDAVAREQGCPIISRSDRPHDNAVAEAFFSALKRKRCIESTTSGTGVL